MYQIKCPVKGVLGEWLFSNTGNSRIQDHICRPCLL